MEKDLLGVAKKHLSLLLKDCDLNKLQEMNDNFDYQYTYDAVSLEGKNKIPYEDVIGLIRTGGVIQYCERDKKEILNHYNTFNSVKEIIANKISLTEEKMKDLHELLVLDIITGGVYRNVNIQIFGAKHQPPDNVKVYDRMKKLFDHLKSMEDGLEKAIYAHAQIAKVHPFLDGNGRLARLVMNYYLMKSDYLPVSIPVSLRDEYIKHLETFKVEKTLKPLQDFITELLIKRYNMVTVLLEI